HWPSREEQAAYAAFTLYALHQQSLTTGAHERGVSFGKAVQRLRSTWSEAAVTLRFTAVSTAETIDEVLVHMRGLVSQFRAAQQSLDYVRLAFDLRDLLKPARAASVRLAWGRDFYRTEKDDDNNPAGGITNEEGREPHPERHPRPASRRAQQPKPGHPAEPDTVDS